SEERCRERGGGQEDSSPGPQLFEQTLLLVESAKRCLIGQFLELPCHRFQASGAHGGIFCRRRCLGSGPFSLPKPKSNHGNRLESAIAYGTAYSPVQSRKHALLQPA